MSGPRDRRAAMAQDCVANGEDGQEEISRARGAKSRDGGETGSWRSGLERGAQQSPGQYKVGTLWMMLPGAHVWTKV